MRIAGSIFGWLAQILGYTVGALGSVIFLFPALNTLFHPASTWPQRLALVALTALLGFVAYTRLSFWRRPYQTSGIILLAAVPIVLLGAIGSVSKAVTSTGGWNDLVFQAIAVAGGAAALVCGLFGLLSGALLRERKTN